MFLTGFTALAVVPTLPTAARDLGGVSLLSHGPPSRQGYASGAMQTSQNLGQITVMAVCSGVLNACPGAGAPELAGRAAFALLPVPTLLIVLLAGRARAGTPESSPARLVDPSPTDPSPTGHG